MLTARRRWLVACGSWVSCGVLVGGCAGLFSGGGARRAPTSAGLVARPSRPVQPVAAAVARISAGGFAGYALLRDGHVWAWGDDLEGQVGRAGLWGLSPTPVEVPDIANVVAVAGGANAVYALQRGGTVWAWGDDANYELGDSRGRARQRPVRVQVPGGIVSVAAGMLSAYALRDDGMVWGWGENSVGQLGTAGAYVASATPRPVEGLSGVVAIAAGAGNGYALRRDGTVWAWGDDNFGQLGEGGCSAAQMTGPDGSRCPAVGVPVRIRGLSDVKAIAAGANTAYALRRDGTMWAWGDNSFGALGTGTGRAFVKRPVRVGLAHVAAIGAGSDTAYAVMPDGTLRAWGRGVDGELGNGSHADEAVPTPVLGLSGVVQVAGGGAMAYALDRRGRLWAWGSGFYGQLGNGRRLSTARPTLVLRLSTPAAAL